MTQSSGSQTLKRKLARWISDEYRDLNGSHIETLDRPPTALEFSRLIHVSRPVIIKGFVVPATQKWTNDYLVSKMGDRSIAIAITPNGRADAVSQGPDNKLYFIEPHIEQMSMRDLLTRLADQDSASDIVYLQSQNGNLYSSEYFTDKGQSWSEYEPLREDVPSRVSWCSEALGQLNLTTSNEHTSNLMQAGVLMLSISGLEMEEAPRVFIMTHTRTFIRS